MSKVHAKLLTFSLAILWGRCMGMIVEYDVVGAEGGVHGAIDILSPVIGLEALNGKAKLCTGISNKINDMLMYIRFVLKRERPTIVCIII